jgi:integration host factor subunit alpha
MRKVEIAKCIEERAHISHETATELLEWILTLMKSTLAQGDPVKIADFGNFIVREKAARVGRNPRTGESVTISKRRVATFRASPKLKAAANTAATGQTVGDSASQILQLQKLSS